MAIEDAKLHFMKQHAEKGAKWIAESLELPLYDVVITASNHGISLRKPGERRGRPLNPATAIRRAKEREEKAKRKAEREEIKSLDMNHPKVQLLLASNPNPDPKARLRSSHWKRQRKRVLERDSYTCTYCGDVANTVDHVVSRRAGGDDSMENLVAACMRCNSSKGSVSGAVFLRRLIPK